MDRFPREPRDDEEREACENYASVALWCESVKETAPGRGLACTRRPGHGGEHIAADSSDGPDPVEVLARWPQTPDHVGDAAEMITSTLRGVVRSMFRDGGWEIEIEGGALPGHPGPRFLHLRADELRAEVGQRVTIRIEVDNG